MQPTRQIAALIAAGAVVLTGSACEHNNATDSGPSAAPPSPQTSRTSSLSTSASASSLSRATRAVDTAGDSVPKGQPYDLESDQYRNRPVWDIKVASGKKPEYELLVNAGGDKVVHKKHKDTRDDDAATAAQAKVTLGKALAIADQHRNGGSLDEAEIDSHHGTIVWTAKFKTSNGQDREIIINAKTGKVTGTKTEED